MVRKIKHIDNCPVKLSDGYKKFLRFIGNILIIISFGYFFRGPYSYFFYPEEYRTIRNVRNLLKYGSKSGKVGTNSQFSVCNDRERNQVFYSWKDISWHITRNIVYDHPEQNGIWISEEGGKNLIPLAGLDTKSKQLVKEINELLLNIIEGELEDVRES